MAKPFVKWVGGKRQLLPKLVERLPAKIENYWEPFIGGGALFFHLEQKLLKPHQAFLSDVNEELINVYQVLKYNPEYLIDNLEYLALQHEQRPKEYYYETREWDRLPPWRTCSPYARAGRFIYLNKTCFNGLYRVNSKGQFNVPFGKHAKFDFEPDDIRAASQALQTAQISVANYYPLFYIVGKDDFLYLDPPYVPLSVTSSFTQYTKDGFTHENQVQLLDFCHMIDGKGAKFMQSNSSAEWVIDKYSKHFNVQFVESKRLINADASKRGPVKEVIITNY